VERALKSHRFGSYTLQPAIAAVHAETESAAATDWRQIVALSNRHFLASRGIRRRQPEWQVQQREDQKSNSFRCRDVPWPGSQKIEKRWIPRLGPEVHIVCLEEEIKCPYDCGKNVNRQHCSPDGSRSWSCLSRPDKI
jgi:hypothetical protein